MDNTTQAFLSTLADALRMAETGVTDIVLTGGQCASINYDGGYSAIVNLNGLNRLQMINRIVNVVMHKR